MLKNICLMIKSQRKRYWKPKRT